MAEANSWSRRRVLVTGAGGFIGSHLAETLARLGASVRAFVRYTSRGDHGWLELADPQLAGAIEVFRGDLANPEAVAGALDGWEVVFLLGALIPIPYSYRHPREFVTANVVGTLNVLEAALRADSPRIVHTSTGEVYGTAQTVPINEEHPLHPQSPYAASKVGEVINLGSGTEVSIGELAERVLRLVGRELPVSVDEQRLRPPESEVERLVAATAKAEKLLGWRPSVDLDEGLRRTIEWLTGSLEAYKPSLYNV